MKKVITLTILVILLSISNGFSQKHDTASITIGDLPSANAHHSTPKSVTNTNDFEKLFTRKQTKQIDSIIYAFEKHIPCKIAVVTIDSSFTTAEGFDTYANTLANTWFIDRKLSGNGVVVAISRAYRKMRICTNKDAERILSDDEAHHIIYGYFIPGFKNGNYFEGTRTGLLQLMAVMKQKISK